MAQVHPPPKQHSAHRSKTPPPPVTPVSRRLDVPPTQRAKSLRAVPAGSAASEAPSSASRWGGTTRSNADSINPDQWDAALRNLQARQKAHMANARNAETESRYSQAMQQANLNSQVLLPWLEQQGFFGVNYQKICLGSGGNGGSSQVHEASSTRSGHSSSSMRKALRVEFPLHRAVHENNLPMVELLLRAKADPTYVNSSFLTPCALAKKLNKSHSHQAVIDILSMPPPTSTVMTASRR